MRLTTGMLCILSICAYWACPAGSTDLVIDGQSHQVFDGGHYERLIIRNSDSITVRNAHFSIESADSVVAVRDSRDVVVENSDVDGGGEACEGVSIANSRAVTIARNEIHGIADDGLEISDATGLVIEGNAVYRPLGKGTDGGILGPCYNGHSDGI